MLFKVATLRRIEAGEVDLAFRRWSRARVREGTRMRTAVGLVEVVSVATVSESRISGDDARRAGCASRAELVRRLRRRPAEEPIFRIELRHAGPDPRRELRASSELTEEEREELAARLQATDHRSRGGPWTRRTLNLIARRPGVRAADLAAELGSETRPFKVRVRRLKELGLTESLEVGYRLSPRGVAFLKGSDQST